MFQFALPNQLLGVDSLQQVLAALTEIDYAAVFKFHLANVLQDAHLVRLRHGEDRLKKDVHKVGM